MTNDIRALLSDLETTFKRALEARAQAVATFGPAVPMQHFKDDLQTEAQDLDQKITTAFTVAITKAKQGVHAARRADSESPDHARYQASVAMHAAIVPHLSEDRARERLQSALDDGRLPDVKALVELIPLHHQPRDARTIALLHDAREAVVPPAVRDAEDRATALESAQWLYNMHRQGLGRRVQLVASGRDLDGGVFDPAYVFGERQYPTGVTAVR